MNSLLVPAYGHIGGLVILHTELNDDICGYVVNKQK